MNSIVNDFFSKFMRQFKKSIATCLFFCLFIFFIPHLYAQIPVTCDQQGTLLYREDFGGNSGTVPQRAPNPGWQSSGRTTYQYETRLNPLLPDVGHYALLTNVSATGWSHGFGDHTSPSDPNHGYFLTFDATASSGQFYQFDIDNLCDGKILKFSIYLMNINPPAYDPNAILPNVTIWVEDISTGNNIHSFSTGNIQRTSSPTWVLYEFAFLIPVNVSNVRVHVINNVNTTLTSGNDLAIDDIEVRLCTPPVDVVAMDSVCLGSTATLSGIFENDGTFSEPLAYQWSKSSTPNATWVDIENNSPVLTVNNVSISDAGCYRLAVSSANTINLESCRAISGIFCMAVKQCQMYDTVYKTICANESYSFNGALYSIAGPHTDTLQIAAELDSIITLILTVNPLNQKTETVSICANASYDFYGRTLMTAGTYEDTIAGTDCDTVVTLNLTVRPPLHTEIAEDICLGDSVFFAGKYFYSPGIYDDTLLSVFGCDSLITLTLMVHSPAQTDFNETGCIGQHYRKHGFNFTPDSAGTYHFEQHMQTDYGCDSLVSLMLQVPEMAVEINSSNPDFCNTHETALTAITPNSNIHWSTGAVTPEITVTRHGTYTVTVSELDCELSAQFTIELCPIVIVFPNAITPGTTDGINEYFYLPAADDVLELAITIYDRWGNTVFASDDPYFRWNGTVNGQLMKGVYTYACTLRTIDRKQRRVTGIVTVL
ncbi:MAG: gliding motility-associated C-terminal domain-containing protein [Bacteroidales bacterium]|jgi:gliding motility-associated-like protein|nr:gliding motility-associated C-terminal domain-containing protein [Bacteroidales bacterium]